MRPLWHTGSSRRWAAQSREEPEEVEDLDGPPHPSTRQKMGASSSSRPRAASRRSACLRERRLACKPCMVRAGEPREQVHDFDPGVALSQIGGV